MPTDPAQQLAAYDGLVLRLDDPAIEVDFSKDLVDASELDALTPRLEEAVAAMESIEAGEIANTDEERRVGHYWLRAPGLAPEEELQESIVETIDRVDAMARGVLSGEISPQGDGGAPRFEQVIVVGIGGSALGAMLLADCFGGGDGLPLTVLDNTDPHGFRRLFASLGDRLASTLFVVVSKSGGTPETRNGLAEARSVVEGAGLSWPKRALAITGAGSKLDKVAREEHWIDRFPIPDWVGGRTSLFASVGLVPAALLGVDIRALLAGAAAVDHWTREAKVRANPAARLAACWYMLGQGKGKRNLVLLPYRDRLLLLSRYMQQLVMESLGKREDRKGREVFQGLSVFGNKGSTDQHAFVQQLRDGRDDFIAHFVRVLDDGGQGIAVDHDGATSGDYLDGFWLGTRKALSDEHRPNVTIGLDRIDERSVGGVVALFERAVGLYAELIDINAYHQPGVEAGKKAAAGVLSIQKALLDVLESEPKSTGELARAAQVGDLETAWHVLRHLAANRDDVRQVGAPRPGEARFSRG